MRMVTRLRLLSILVGLATVAASGQQAAYNPANGSGKKHTSAKHDVGSGAGDIGKGTARGVGNLAKGTGKAVVSLATLHPIDAAAHLGVGAGTAGKDIGAGAVKGTGKIVKGTGKAIKHIF